MSVPVPLVSESEAERPLFVGVDVGGTNLKFGLVDNLGRTVRQSRIPTEVEKGPDDAVGRMAASIRAIISDRGLAYDDLTAVGLATPGTMDVPAGMMLEPHNLPTFRQFPIRDRLREACGKPVAFANDANAAAYGEYWVGSGKDYPSIIMLTLGTGLGGGIIVGDVSIDGEHSHGSECGHIIIDHNEQARVCPCGQPGHLEAYASATGLIKRTEEELATGRPTSVRARLDDGAKLSPLLLAQEAEKGDAFALELILDTAMYLGIGVVTLMHTIDPGAVVLGGAMDFGGHESDLGRRFLQRVRDEVQQRAFPVLAEKVTIDFASLGGDAGYIGAAGIARTAYQKASGA
jgi:glucokinase